MPVIAPRFKRNVALDQHRISVSWSTLPPEDVGGLVLRYRVYYRNYYTYETRNVTVKSDQLKVELTNLDPGTYFIIWITALTALGEGPTSSSDWRKTCKWSAISYRFWYIQFLIVRFILRCVIELENSYVLFVLIL